MCHLGIHAGTQRHLFKVKRGAGLPPRAHSSLTPALLNGLADASWDSAAWKCDFFRLFG